VIAVSNQGRDVALFETIRANSHGALSIVAYGVSENQRAEMRLTPYSYPLTSGGGKPGQGYPCVAFTERTRAVAYGGNNTSGPIDIATACNAHGSRRYDFESETFVTLYSAWGVRRLTPLECERLQGFPDGWTAVIGKRATRIVRSGEYAQMIAGRPDAIAFDRTRGTSSGDIAGPLRKCGASTEGVNDAKADTQCVAFTERTRADGRNLETQAELAYALTNPGSGGRTQSRQVAGPWGVRRLTPLECERLQGFPDGWTAVIGKRATRIDDETIRYLRCQYYRAYGVILSDDEVRKIASDSARYRQLGNAVAVPVIVWLGQRLVEVTHVKTE